MRIYWSSVYPKQSLVSLLEIKQLEHRKIYIQQKLYNKKYPSFKSILPIFITAHKDYS